MRNRNTPFSGALMVKESVGAAESFDLHRVRREALNPYFSVKAVLGAEGVVRGKAEKLGKIFEQAVQKAKGGNGDGELNLSDVFFAYSNDVVRAFSFGSDNNLLDDLEEAKKQRENLARLLTGVPLNMHFPWIPNLLAKVLPLFLGEKAIPPAVMDMIRFRAKIGRDIEAIFSEKGEAKPDHSIFYDLRDSTTLPPEEKTVQRLQDEATLLIMAGTESTAKSMTIAAFYLLHQPSVMVKLRQELAEARRASKAEQIPVSVLLTLPYLNAIIQESHRLSFGVTRRLVRYSPTETLTYTATSGPRKGKTYTLPPGTKMSSSTLCVHTDETLFPDPWTFDPERWIVSEGSQTKEVSVARNDTGNRSTEAVNLRKRSLLALGKGHRKCIGINLANAEMCLALAMFAGYEMGLFETEESDVKFAHDYQISHPRMGSRGVRVVVEGGVEG